MSWVSTTLGKVCEIYQPKTISTKEMVEDGAYPVYGANGVIGRYNHYNHEESQLLITCRGATCGSVNVSTPKSWINGNAMVVRPKADDIDRRFLEYLFRGGVDLSKTITGSAQPQITRQTLAPIQISYPESLPEQQRIVGKLDAAFAALAEALAHVERNRANARELFESYLSGVFEGKGERWQEVRLAEVADQISTGPFGTMLHKADYVPNGIPLVNPMNIVNSRIVPSDRMMVNDATRERLSSYVLRKGDVVIARRGELGRCALVTEKEAGWLCGTGSFFMRLSKEVDPEFFVLVFGSHLFKDKLQQLSVGTTMSSLNITILESLELPLPPVKEQRALLDRFHTLRESLDQLETTYAQKLTELEGLKKAVLGAAFRGEL
ncbi:MAG: restriction endonuclease subunit S [Flavobacteriales bacterium]|nr:restriction endonuclease subunit S [Flavobacteriales bacterium]